MVASVSARSVPAWFAAAKLGIFIHWGPYSVPGWAPVGGNFGQMTAGGDWSAWFAANPYAEWYQNSYQIEGSPTQRFHQRTFGAGVTYTDFAPQFNQAVERWNPHHWADLFAAAGAKYVVLTAKHHDGFLLWPSDHPNPHQPAYGARRDLCGELGQAVRSRGMAMGYYYSGGLDWTFNPQVIRDFGDLLQAVPPDLAYATYADAHWRELIYRYRTAVLWNDIAYPATADLEALFAEYYRHCPDGLVNDRFTQRLGPDGVPVPVPADFATPEYRSFEQIQARPWETCRGLGASFGYNRAEGPGDHQSVGDLVCLLVDVVSKNGNLLLNVGPMADGTIPALQAERLEGLGRWLAINGAAIYGSRPWVIAEGMTACGLPLRFTQQPDSLYAIVLGQPAAAVVLPNLQADIGMQVHLLGHASPLPWQQLGRDLGVSLADVVSVGPAACLQFSPPPRWLPSAEG